MSNSPKVDSLGEFYWALKNEKSMLKNGYANIFYIRDEDNTLWAVYAYWSSDGSGWGVYAGSVEDSDGWYAGYRVLSQVFWELGNSENWDLETRIKTLEKFKSQVEKILKLN